MKKIYESMKIETWKTIAYRVQKLNFLDGTEQEFQENLAKLSIILQELGIEENIGKRNPQSTSEIGTSSLLQSIQDIHVPNNYKKSTFYEKIYQLADLGVQDIEFRPVNSYRGLPDLVKKSSKENIILEKCYTDGTFQLLYAPITDMYAYSLYELCNANYVLLTTLFQSLTTEERYSTKQKESKVILKTFDGIFPSREEIMKFEFPELVVPKQSLIWGELPRVKEKFETFDKEKASYQKRFKKDNNGQYYYE